MGNNLNRLLAKVPGGKAIVQNIFPDTSGEGLLSGGCISKENGKFRMKSEYFHEAATGGEG